MYHYAGRSAMAVQVAQFYFLDLVTLIELITFP